MTSENRRVLLFPALLAALLNLSREIIKDVEDSTGDSAQGIKTTASLSPAFLKTLLTLLSFIYVAILPLPWAINHFSRVYLAMIIVIIAPVHLYRLHILMKQNWQQHCGVISRLIKIEMLAGLSSLALDRFLDPLIN